MVAISANELKTRGIAAIESALAGEREATISVRGKNRYVVMPLEQFHYLRECELEAALAQTRSELATGRAVRESAEAHVERMEREDEE
ncbi:MAG: type II toxin-antitoxin system Phd/YefM family antitoxin [Deferrisomatales bacterium]